MKNNLRIIPIFIVSLLLTLTFSCKKEVPKVLPTLTTASLGSITATTASGGGSITNDGGAIVTARGVCWSLTQNPTTSDNKTSDGSGIGSFTSAITGLTPGATYNIRAYATNSVGTSYGNQTILTTTAILPILTTTALSAITSTTATSGGIITNDGGAAVTVRGVCWSTSQNPTISNAKTTNENNNLIVANAKTTDGIGIGSFSSSITGLTPGASYYVRAYATNNIGTSYGNQLTLNALAVVPTITTTAISEVTTTTASGGGNITSDGGATVTARGSCWSTNQNPTTADSKSVDGTGMGPFTSAITGLTPGTTYFFRAYAINSAGTVYGNQVVSTTMATLPTITTLAVTSITEATASSGGNITFDGGAAVIARGVCWSTSQNPTINDNKTINGMGSSSFISSISGLSPGTTYYIRAYATNSMGTGYGNQLSATTLAVAPTITTLSVSPTTEMTATGGGNITSDGGSPVTSRGVCWSTNQNPTILNNRTLTGTGTGSFTSILSGLTINTVYYVRSYATNAIGTSYGTETSVVLFLNVPGPNVTDVDGNLYHSVKIGAQIWTVENLKTTKYRNGSAIPHVTDAAMWNNQTTGAYCDFGNSTSNGVTYGHLYNYYTVIDSKQFCPSGWHVPTNSEWSVLINYLSGINMAGIKLKEAGTAHWSVRGGNNISGFTALAGSWRGGDGLFYYNTGHVARWWTSTESSAMYSWNIGLDNDNIIFQVDVNYYHDKKAGHSVRCVKD